MAGRATAKAAQPALESGTESIDAPGAAGEDNAAGPPLVIKNGL